MVSWLWKTRMIAPIGAIFAAVAAQAQVISGSATLPSTTISGVTVQGFTGALVGTPIALPTAGNFINLQFLASSGDIFTFSNLPASGSGSSGALNTVVNLTLNPGATPIGPLNVASSYSFNADATDPISGNDATQIRYIASGVSNFSFNGSNYQLDLNNAQATLEGTPSIVGLNAITGRITNLGATSAPEPGTLALVALGTVGLVVQRRRRG